MKPLAGAKEKERRKHQNLRAGLVELRGVNRERMLMGRHQSVHKILGVGHGVRGEYDAPAEIRGFSKAAAGRQTPEAPKSMGHGEVRDQDVDDLEVIQAVFATKVDDKNRGEA